MNYLKTLTDLYRLKKNVKLSAEKMRSLQDGKLRKLLRFAWEHSVYYRTAFEKAGITEEQLDTLPLSCFPTIDKQMLLEHFDELVTVPDLKQEKLREFDAGEAADRKPYQGKYHVVHSSGSTGKPGYFVYDEDAWSQMLLGIIRAALWGMSMPQILRLLMKRPRIVYIAATDGRYGGAMAVGDGTRGVGASQLYLDIKTPVTEWIRQLKEFRPNIVIGYPSAIKILAQLMENGEVSLDAERVISCGEPLGSSLRAYLENIFRTQVVNFYGASESLALGVETDLEEGMLLFDDMNIIEVEDLWFEDGRGNREFLYPLAIEGFCIEGLKDYQFRQTTKDTFEMYAETGNGVSREQIRQEMLLRMRKILAEKRLDYVQFYVNFVEEILPDIQTGKKPLICASNEPSAVLARAFGECRGSQQPAGLLT